MPKAQRTPAFLKLVKQFVAGRDQRTLQKEADAKRGELTVTVEGVTLHLVVGVDVYLFGTH